MLNFEGPERSVQELREHRKLRNSAFADSDSSN